jgi:uncharacterized cofD-like protein
VQQKVVALGGGHGLAATLSALRKITSEITAIVTVADNGGSSGRLREEFSILPPGDLRMALSALCADDEWGRSWARIMQHRFTSDGALNGHAVGNLLLAALWDRNDDPVVGLDRVGSLLKVVGRVLPMSSIPLDIEGTFLLADREVIVRGQAEVATSPGKLISLRLIPDQPPALAQSCRAIGLADWITMGPGSWFSSVLPHLLVPEQRQSLVESKARRIVILNLDATPESHGSEYAGYTAEEHCSLFYRYAPDFRADYVIADSSVVSNLQSLEEQVRSMGGELIVADLRMAEGSVNHDPEKLASVFGNIMTNSLIG